MLGKWECCGGYAVSSAPTQEVRPNFPLPMTPYLFWGLSPLYPCGSHVGCEGWWTWGRPLLRGTLSPLCPCGSHVGREEWWTSGRPLLRSTLTSQLSCSPLRPFHPKQKNPSPLGTWKYSGQSLDFPKLLFVTQDETFSLKAQIVNVSSLWVMTSWFCVHGIKAATENTDWMSLNECVTKLYL